MTIKTKFSSGKAKANSSELQEKLERIALAIADETIDGTKTLKGVEDLDGAQAVLKTLTNYFATVNKVDIPEGKGSAFDGYRKKVEDGGGDGNTVANAGVGTTSSSGYADPGSASIVRFPTTTTTRLEDASGGGSGAKEE